MRLPEGHDGQDDHTAGVAVTAMRASAARRARPRPLLPLLPLPPLQPLLLLGLAGLCLWPPARAAPAARRNLMVSQSMMEYLARYKYVDFESKNLLSKDQMVRAIKQMQAYAGVPLTGVEDEATARALRRPRCGMPDVDLGAFHPSRAKRHHHGEALHGGGQRGARTRRYTASNSRWPSSNVSWSLQGAMPGGLSHGEVRREITDAFKVWSGVSTLKFEERRSNADIDISFQRRRHNDGFDFDGRGNILAHAFFPGKDTTFSITGDVHFDAEEMWFMLDNGPGADAGISLFAVAAHEIGHALGLKHSSVPGALMTPHYQELPRDFKLPEDDVLGITVIYGSNGRQWGRLPHYTPEHREPVQPHRPERPTPGPPHLAPATTPRATHRYTPNPPRHPDKPDTCNTAYDAVAVIRKEIFVFKGKYLWRITDKGLEEGYPALITSFWSNLPANFTHVDAVYERNDNKKIVFFVGKEYFVYNASTFVKKGTLTDFGLPPTLTHIDDVMVWGYNGKTYLFSGSMYWRLDEDYEQIELDYPRDMSMWRGVGYNIDAVAQFEGVTYFFKGKGYWKFNDMEMRVEGRFPNASAPFLMGCPKPHGNWFDWDENAIDIYNDIESSFSSQHDYDDDDDSAAQQITSAMTVLCLCLSLSAYLTM